MDLFGNCSREYEAAQEEGEEEDEDGFFLPQLQLQLQFDRGPDWTVETRARSSKEPPFLPRRRPEELATGKDPPKKKQTGQVRGQGRWD